MSEVEAIDPISQGYTAPESSHEIPMAPRKPDKSKNLSLFIGGLVLLLLLSAGSGYLYVCYQSGAEFRKQVDSLVDKINGDGDVILTQPTWDGGLFSSKVRIATLNRKTGFVAKLSMNVQHTPVIQGDRISVVRIYGGVGLPKDVKKMLNRALARPLRISIAGNFFSDRTGGMNMKISPVKTKSEAPFKILLSRGISLKAMFVQNLIPSNVELLVPHIFMSGLSEIEELKAETVKIRADYVNPKKSGRLMIEGQFSNLEMKSRNKSRKNATIRRGSFKYSLGKVPDAALRYRGAMVTLDHLKKERHLMKILAKTKNLTSELGLNVDFPQGKVKAQARIILPTMPKSKTFSEIPNRLKGNLNFSLPKKVLIYHAPDLIPMFDRLVAKKFLQYKKGWYKSRGTLSEGKVILNGNPVPLEMLIGN